MTRLRVVAAVGRLGGSIRTAVRLSVVCLGVLFAVSASAGDSNLSSCCSVWLSDSLLIGSLPAGRSSPGVQLAAIIDLEDSLEVEPGSPSDSLSADSPPAGDGSTSVQLAATIDLEDSLKVEPGLPSGNLSAGSPPAGRDSADVQLAAAVVLGDTPEVEPSSHSDSQLAGLSPAGRDPAGAQLAAAVSLEDSPEVEPRWLSDSLLADSPPAGDGAAGVQLAAAVVPEDPQEVEPRWLSASLQAEPRPAGGGAPAAAQPTVAVVPEDSPETESRWVTGSQVAQTPTDGDEPAPAAAETGEPWYSWFWPLGDRVEAAALKDEYVPFKSVGEIPGRPALALELGDPFLDTGQLHEGFEVPLLGAVWQPRLWAYMIARTALQTFDNGAPGRQRDTEWANRLDMFFNLQLTGTEKIILGLRPLDQNKPDAFTRYTFEGADKGFQNELNLDIETLFFEGDFGSLFPNLDPEGIEPIDLGFTVGRQPIVFQEGILINDTIDAVGLIRNNIPFPGTSNFRVSGLWGWNRLDRNDPSRDNEENTFALFTAADAPVSTYNLDLIYVDDNGSPDADGFYVGASAIQRIAALGGLSTAFRINSSIALDGEVGNNPSGANVIGNGTLLSAELSKTPKGSDDIAYFNPFWSIGNFTQAGREAILGGPLASLGILFASPNLSNYGAEVNPFTDDVVGFATGYQAFWDNKRRNLILEMAGRHSYGDDGFDSLGFGFQLQQALGQHVQLQFEGFYTLNEGRSDGAGARAEILVVY